MTEHLEIRQRCLPVLNILLYTRKKIKVKLSHFVIVVFDPKICE